MSTLTEAESQQTTLDVDPVCGMSVYRAEAREHDLAVAFADREYVFCAPSCRAKFVHEPVAYAVTGRDAF